MDILEYIQRQMAGVRRMVDMTMKDMTEELDRKVKFAGGERTVAEMLLLSASQSLSHNGEIAALKGVQGAKGLPI